MRQKIELFNDSEFSEHYDLEQIVIDEDVEISRTGFFTAPFSALLDENLNFVLI